MRQVQARYNSSMRLCFLAIAYLMTAPILLAKSSAPRSDSATVPVTLDHNRVIIDVYFPMADGTKIRVRAWIDPGDTELSMTESLSRKLGLRVSRDAPDKGKSQAPGELEVGTMKIGLGEIKEATALSQGSIAPGSSASIKLPASVLRNYDVVLDYVNREFTIARPGTTHFQGKAVEASIGRAGLIQLKCNIAGEQHTVSFDPGTSVSWLSGELISRWHKEHPHWPSMIGAVGPANLWGLPSEPSWQVLRIPEMQCGGFALTDGLAVPFTRDVLDWFQKRAGVPTVGLIGADVLMNFSVGVDYAHSSLYFKQLSKYAAPGIDVVGLCLRPEEDGHYSVIGVAEHDRTRSVPEVRKGDLLMTVDNARITGATMGQVWSLLSGSPGDLRTLGLVRDGKPISVKARVYRFLPLREIARKH
ncbi:MAG: hypothetical protein JOZ36_08100 [Acidobacteria bacterium]|nr:hypothetical protein [Acidobacteriota bacterium]